MSERTKTIVSTAVIATIGVGVLFVITKYRKSILQKLRTFGRDRKNPFHNQNIHVVNSYEECKTVVNKLKAHCAEYSVLGFDCEWVTVGGTRRPIALLQLASHKGLCALIRLCTLNKIPDELTELLNDETILKVGVGPIDDAKYLSQDYAIKLESTLDLRYIANYVGCEPLGIGKMAERILNVELDKNWRIRCSDWENTVLSDKQIEYAAKDVHVAIEIFKNFARRIVPHYPWTNKNKALQEVLKICDRFTDQHYNYRQVNAINQNKKQLLSTIQSRKVSKRHFATRTKPLYDNCLMQAPDGELLCTCDRKKAEWYVHKNLGAKVLDDPFTVRLNFEPAGRAVGEVGKYYQQEKMNQCVVCGRNDSFIRKNVVPRDYRKHFPLIMKEHTSHDVLLLCYSCHQTSNMSDLSLRRKLSHLCSAPLASEDGGRKELPIADMNEIRKAARALVNPNIPEKRLQELRDKLLTYFPAETEITDDFLYEYSNIGIFKPNENFCAHGERVVDYFKQQECGLIQLERMWRQHFLDVMKPKHMPDLWSVEHNFQRLEIRKDEGRVDDFDLMLAGMKKNSPPSQSESVSLKEEGDNDSTTRDVSSCFDAPTASSATNNDFIETEFLSNNNTMATQYQTVKSDPATVTDSESTFDIDDFKSLDSKYDSDDTDSTLSQPSSTFMNSDFQEDEENDNSDLETTPSIPEDSDDVKNLNKK